MSGRQPVGGLRHYVTLEAPVDTPDDNGGVSRTFVATATFWARIAPKSSAMIDRADQQQQLVTHDITFRAWPGLTGAMRLRLGTRLFQILSIVDADEKATTLRASCEEIKP
jgi:SPP1 family predicted phage head-tail adaptor